MTNEPIRSSTKEALTNCKYVLKYNLLQSYRGNDKFSKPIVRYSDLLNEYGYIDRIFVYNMNRIQYMPLKISYRLDEQKDALPYINKKIPYKQSFELDFTTDPMLKESTLGTLYCNGFNIIEIVQDY